MISRLFLTFLRKPLMGSQSRLLCTDSNSKNLLKIGIWKVSTKKYKSQPVNHVSLWNKAFGKYLLLTNTISSGVLMVIGDYIAQQLEFRLKRKNGEQILIDKGRIWRMFIVGAALGPIHHYGYLWMDALIPATTLKTTFLKILIDELVMSPICISTFFYTACFLENKSITETNQELKSKFFYVYLTDWMFWPGAQFVNFHYLQSKYRVMVVNICTTVYNIFLSFMKHDFD